MSEPIKYNNGIRVHRTADARARRAQVRSAFDDRDELMRRIHEYTTSPNTERRSDKRSFTNEEIEKSGLNTAWLMLRENRLSAKDQDRLRKRFNMD